MVLFPGREESGMRSPETKNKSAISMTIKKTKGIKRRYVNYKNKQEEPLEFS
jgi:hypothetical protein